MHARLNRFTSRPAGGRISPTRAGILAAIALSGLSAGLAAGVAQAATPATCPAAPLSTPFAAWGDNNSYSLVPGGNFEGPLSGWIVPTVVRRVAVSKTEPGYARVGAWSLELPAGAVVQTPPVCVSSTENTFRFFARGLSTGATVTAQVIYGSDPGQKSSLTGTWEPSSIFHTGPALSQALQTKGTVMVALRITATSGTARIDDLYQDPRMKK